MASSHMVTQADQSKTIEVAKGDSVTIQLPENPATGYRWSLDQHDPTALEPGQKPSFQLSSPAVGGGGDRTFTFVARAPGQSSVELNLRRAWEGEKLAQKNFRVNFRIQE